MRKIWKFTISEQTRILVPEGSEILDFQLQKGKPQIWLMVDEEKPTVTRNFEIFGTDRDVPDEAQYIGTFQLLLGELVFHLFEV